MNLIDKILFGVMAILLLAILAFELRAKYCDRFFVTGGYYDCIKYIPKGVNLKGVM